MALKIYFGRLATDYIADSGRTVAEVAQAIGKTPENQFSKWKRGQWTYIAEPKLLRIIEEVAGRDRSKRVALMIAYLIDMTPEVFRPLIDIKPFSGGDDNSAPVGTRLPDAIRNRIEEIGRAYARDDDFMRMADSLAGFAKSINRRAEEKKG